MAHSGAKIAVLSGKGGAGKTLVAVNLSCAADRAAYVDCDVEEPNGRLFFAPERVREEDVSVKIPALIADLCVGCRKCVDFCRFHALAFVKNKPVVFDQVCHSCGGCALLCSANALYEQDKTIGRIQRGVSGTVLVHTGILDPGEAVGLPIIRRLLNGATSDRDIPIVIDCPPGSACAVMESIREADYCILVAEPTIFGVHNLAMVHELVKLFNKPYGVVLNKCLDQENPAEAYCAEDGIPILARIPFDSELGALNANGKIAARLSGRYLSLFCALLDAVMQQVQP